MNCYLHYFCVAVYFVGAYISGIIWLLLAIRYTVIRVSYPENYIAA